MEASAWPFPSIRQTYNSLCGACNNVKGDQPPGVPHCQLQEEGILDIGSAWANPQRSPFFTNVG